MAIAYGQITIVDISDLGQLSVYPTSNQPYSVIYDPNSTNQYNPDWSTDNLVLTPVIYYGNQSITPTNSIVSWYKDNSEVAISAGVGTDGKLTISNRAVLSPTGAKLVSYTCKVAYSPPNTGVTLHAEGKITFSLIEQPTTVKSINITGSTLFLYNGDKELQSPATITLKANPQNCSISSWYYYTAQGTKTTIASTSNTLTVNHSNTTYFNGQNSCTFGVQANSDLYDEITVVKVYDGASGDSAVVAVLSNESQTISFNSDDTPVANAYADAKTTLTVYDGNNNVTKDCVITVTQDSGIHGDWNTSTYEYTVNEIDNSGKVSFKIEYTDPTLSATKTLYKTFSLVKIKPGQDGKPAVSYHLDLSALVVNKNISDDGTISYSPASITLTGYKKIGDNNRELYSCRFSVSVNDGGETTLNSSDASTVVYSTNKDFSTLKFTMYEAGSTTNPLDSQTVVQTSDGKKGDTGTSGVDGVYSGIGNSSDQLACNNSGAAKAAQTFTIPYYAVQGATYIPVSVKASCTDTNVSINNNNTTATSGKGTITISVASGANLIANTTTVTIELTAQAKNSAGTTVNTVSTHNYSLTKSIQGDAGVNAITLRAFAEGGGVFINGQGSDKLTAILTSGTTTVDTNVSYQWYEWNGSIYAEKAGATNATLEIKASDIFSFGSYKVTATYNGKSYDAYVSILDKSDPLQIYLFSTVGEKLVNSQGVGIVYARVYQSGEELDSVDGWIIGEAKPTNPQMNQYWVGYSSESDGTVVIEKYNGSAWIATTPTYNCDYNWSYGAITSTNRFIPVNSTIVDKKTNFNLTVTYPKTSN